MNPNDATLRNVRAAGKKIRLLTARLKEMQKFMRAIEKRINALERISQRPSGSQLTRMR
jgi:hypothetical protein